MALEGLLRAAGLVVRGDALRRLGSTLLPVGASEESRAAAWDLYRDWLPRLAREPQTVDVVPADVAAALAQATAGLVAGVAHAEDGAFIHLGTSRDFRDAVAPGSPLRRLFPFASQRESAAESGAQIEAAFVGRSLLSRGARLAPGAVVDHCRVEGALTVERSAMVSGVHVPAGESLHVRAERVCYQTLAGGGEKARDPQRVTVVLGIDDNPKLPLGEATFSGGPLPTWMAERGVTEADLWTAGARTLHEARLFVADSDDPDRSILDWLQVLPADRGEESAARWRAARRHSLRELLDAADAEAISAERAALAGDVAAARVVADVEANGDASFANVFGALTPAQRERTLAGLIAVAEAPATAPLHRARYWRVLADLAAPPDEAERCEDRAAAAVREAVSRTAGAAAARFTFASGRIVRVASPVRVDFGGGWTDTPPFSLERGGAVLNAALTLDGELPVWAEAEALPHPEIVLEAADLGFAARVRTAADVAGYADPADPFALQKACLVLSGVISPTDGDPLARLRAGGAGLRLRTGARIPRGSGLGGSSVVGAAALRALGELMGAPQDDAELSWQTLELEQLMTTGGGWQDQMGAIAPGLKPVSTEPGMEQLPRVDRVALTPEQQAAFESHLVVAYTGQHRLAKNILRQVVMRYLGRDPLAMQALYQLRAVAEQLARAARALDFELFGTLVNQAWLLNKTLDPQTSFQAIERLFSALAPHVYGAKLVGAGGGGFMVAITRQPNAADLVADLMARDRDFAYAYVVPA
ncbi:MAG TPA: L-fucokinase, partial [Chloroflexota bacterium]|nr:L-fucokinase [Chloroflexota bacterium]